MSRMVLVSDIWEYLRIRKRFWLLPIILLLFLLGLLIVFTEGSALSPFLYILF